MSTSITDDFDAQGQRTRVCPDREHEPPRHIHIPAGKQMVHTCDTCGKVTGVKSPERAS